MEQFRIKDFNSVFSVGIEKFLQDAINAHSKKKNPSKIKLKKAIKILKKELFVRLL